MNLNIPENIKSIKPYEPGKPMNFLEKEYGIKKTVKLASNENPLGPSPLAVRAITDHILFMNRYPDGSALDLTRKIADRFGLSMENVIVGNGSDDIIALLAHAFLSGGQEAVMPRPSFLMYEISVKASGGVPVMVPLKDLAIDLDGMARAVTHRTVMIFLTNPNNPTGTFFTREQFSRFMNSLPDNVLVVVDEAYIEFARNRDIYDSLEIRSHDKGPFQKNIVGQGMDEAEISNQGMDGEEDRKGTDGQRMDGKENRDPENRDPRIISLRTFSKAYGLAGLRVGYGIMDDEIA
ncbi:MAG: aminotransferase class I/II-fold pyridoxal phosphate-dependent enzyme, partial [Desulfamplus sp.]|nr:aminotransferase class I/II-fold pyridoxal phosphate-dependent enzyme [Desulfamplus sp.]